MELLDSEPSILLILIASWPLYALPSLLTLPVLFWREKRLPWAPADALVLIGPWLIWLFVFMSTPDVERKLLHMIVESFLMGCTAPGGLAIVVMGREHFKPLVLRIGILAVSALFAMVLCAWFFRVAN